MSFKRSHKILVFLLFLTFLLGGAALMYTVYIKGKKSVVPTSVPYRTEHNPYYVDSLKKAGYYDSMNAVKKMEQSPRTGR